MADPHGSVLVQASPEVRALPAAQLAPPAPRPRSTAAVASRLIGSALGIRGLVCAALLPTSPACQPCGGALILTSSVGRGRDFAFKNRARCMLDQFQSSIGSGFSY